MKIAVFHNLPSGGAKRALYGYVEYLMKMNHQVDVFVPSTANEEFLPLRDIASNVNVFPVSNTLGNSIYSTIKYIPPQVKHVSLRDTEKTEQKIAGVINNGNYDVVFSEQDQYTMAPFLLKYLKKTPCILLPATTKKRCSIGSNISKKGKQFIRIFKEV